MAFVHTTTLARQTRRSSQALFAVPLRPGEPLEGASLTGQALVSMKQKHTHLLHISFYVMAYSKMGLIRF